MASSPPAVRALRRQAIPNDYSCLFHAVSYLTSSSCSSSSPSPSSSSSSSSGLRAVCAQAVLKDSTRFSEAILGKKPKEYAEWIQDTFSWGGYIELQVLSEHLKTELHAIDASTKEILKFGTERGFEKQAYLLYTGTHYDAVVGVRNDEKEQRLFVCGSEAKGLKKALDAFVESEHALWKEADKRRNPGITSVEICGAGTAEANGEYKPKGSMGGRQGFECKGIMLCYNPSEARWEITDPIMLSTLYVAKSEDNSPPLNGWTVDEGEGPAPKLKTTSA